MGWGRDGGFSSSAPPCSSHTHEGKALKLPFIIPSACLLPSPPLTHTLSPLPLHGVLFLLTYPLLPLSHGLASSSSSFSFSFYIISPFSSEVSNLIFFYSPSISSPPKLSVLLSLSVSHSTHSLTFSPLYSSSYPVFSSLTLLG